MHLRVVIKKYIVLAGFFLCTYQSARAQTDTILQRIVLIGDAGQLTNGRHPVVDAVRNLIPLDKKTTVLFLGDNLYKNGLPDAQNRTLYQSSRAVLDSQINIADGKEAKVYMIPGNHDWENGSRGGYNAILREQLYVVFAKKDQQVKFRPEDGCPGPVEVLLGNEVTIILFDSQWWLHPYTKPEIESDCKCKTKDELVSQIEDIASHNANKLIILACHHPFKSNGIHGGFFTLKQHIFPFTDIKKSLYLPLPVIGSIYPISRSVFGSPQDIKHPTYTNMIESITAAIKRTGANTVFVSGHDHNLQLIQEKGYNYVISGGGCKQNRTSNNKNSLFNSTTEGFAVMEVSIHKNVTVTFYTVGDTIEKSKLFSILNFSKLPAPILDSATHITVDDPFLKYKDTISKPVSEEFSAISGLKKYFMGQNYRAEWSTPVNMKIFNLRTEKGGFRITGLGGGKQTRTLHLEEIQTGKEWVLRSVNKSPSGTIPEAFQGTLVADILKELKSASYPFGALIVPGLSKPLHLASPQPELFFVPDDPNLGFYRPLFANTVCMLEKSDPTFSGKKALSTDKVLYKEGDGILSENDHVPIQNDVLRARLLDILIGDYDRHFDQWKWGSIDTGKGKLYYPIPRDRDQAFFNSDGALLKVISSHTLPFLKGFRNDIPKVNWLGYAARDFDRIFLTGLDELTWKKTIDSVQQELSDSVISSAVHRLPPEIFRIHGETIIQKLKSRRDNLGPAAMKYYHFISKNVNVLGSNQKEYFRVTSEGSGLRVRVYSKSRGYDTSFLRYDRLFDPAVTREIRLFGLNDNDYFDIDKNAASKIKLRVIGGEDNDTFDVKGHVEALLYDLKGAGNFIKDSSHVKNRFSKDPPVNEKNILGFNYNTSKFPQVHLNYNSDDGILIGAGFSRRTFGFRNLPYASDQKLSLLYAVDRSALQLQYRGEFNHITRNLDLLLQGKLASPELKNYFGPGGNSNTRQHPLHYYQTRYNSFEFSALFRHRYYETLQVLYGPYFYNYSARTSDNKRNVLSEPPAVGLDSARIFSNKSYLGGKLAAIIDNRNNQFFPTRGILWLNDLTSVAGMKSGSHNFTSFTTDMTIYASLSDPAKLIAVLKWGGGRIFSKNYEYFQALSAGANNGLSGFRKNRYAGSSTLYGSLEFRIKVCDVDSYILPGQLGLITFYDALRVRTKHLTGASWHGAYGVGLYYLPFNLFAISARVGFSQNEKMFNFSLGTKLNLTY